MARLLVIEDNPDNLELMTYLLKAFGHEVATACDGAEGVDTLRCHDFDMVVCDVHLPRMDGYEVAECLKADPAYRNVPLVAVTALAMVGDKDKVLASGFDGYIAKPINPQEFVTQVEAFLPESVRGEGFTSSQIQVSEPGLEPAAGGTEIRVLVVDDSRVNRELLRSTLEPFGYRLTLAATVVDGLAQLREDSFDLIISDVHMPNEDGYAFLRQLKENPAWDGIPVMVISSSVLGGAEREKTLAMGARRFVLRPIEPWALLQEVAAALEGHGEASDGDHPGR